MKKKIMILIGSLDLGGTEKQLLLQLSELNKYHDFYIVTIYKKGFLFDDFKQKGIKVFDISRKSKNNFVTVLFNYLISIYKIFKKIDPDIVNFYLPHSYLLGGFLSYIFPKKKYLMSRRSLNNYQSKYVFSYFIERYILHRRMTLIIANSFAIKKQLVSLEGVKPQNVDVVYNGINFKKKQIIKTRKVIRITCLANLINYKNHKMIIRACNEIPRNLNYCVDFIGEGTDDFTKEIIKEIKKYDLECRIKLKGQIRNPDKNLENSDIGILVSDEEGFPNSILEYMNNSLPIIATNVGGNNESIQNGRNGFLIKKNDYMELSKKLIILIKDKALRLKMGKNSLSIVNKDFNIRKTVIKYKKLYDKL